MLQDILLIILGIIIGAIIGFILARKYMEKYIKENPPINEKTLEALMSTMGRKPSQKQVKQMMAQMNRLQK